TIFNTTYYRKYMVAGGGINLDYQPSSRNFFGLKYWQTNVWGHPYMNTVTQFVQPSMQDSFARSSFTGKDSYLYNFGNANYHHNFDSLGRNYVDLNIDFNRFRQNRTLEGAFDVSDQYRNVLPQKFWNLSEQIDIKKTISPKASVLFGVQLSHTTVNNDLKYYDLEQGNYVLNDALSQDYDYRENYQAAYVSMSRSFGNRLSTSAGLRFERTDYESTAEKAGLAFDSTYYNLYPSLSLSYAPSQKHQFGYSLSRKIIRPNIENLYPGRIYRSNNYFTENNPFLQPTLLLVNELSYLFKQRYSISLTYSGTKNSNAKFVIPVTEDNTLKFKETLLNYGTIHQLSVVFSTSINLLKGKWQMYVTPYYNHVVYSGTVGPNKVRVVNNDFNIIADNYFQLSKNKTLAAFLTFNYYGPSKDIAAERTNSLSSLTFQLRKTINKFSFSLIASDIYNGKSRTKSNLYANYLLSNNYVDRFSYTRAIQFKIRYSFGNSNLAATKNRNTANQDIRNRAN
ncbi:MAG TPA: outer membrane beta-barrel family protein, partial [Chitinophagaceae bacterium]|nr:outer membrane beta-barrel family protein [Chitinophagaceae bacterium]